MLKRLLNPTNDFVFQKLFGTKKNESILVQFLNDILDLNGTAKIQQATVRQAAIPVESSSQQAVVLDILCKDAKNQSCIVEMQVADEREYFEQHALYCLSQAYGSQLSIGDTYDDLKHVFYLAILNFQLFPDEVPYKSRHVITEKKTEENLLTGQTYIFLELDKLSKKKELNPSFTTKTERWAYFFKYSNSMSDEEWENFIKGDDIMTKAYAEIDSANWSREEQLAYERHLTSKGS